MPSGPVITVAGPRTAGQARGTETAPYSSTRGGGLWRRKPQRDRCGSSCRSRSDQPAGGALAGGGEVGLRALDAGVWHAGGVVPDWVRLSATSLAPRCRRWVSCRRHVTMGSRFRGDNRQDDSENSLPDHLLANRDRTSGCSGILATGRQATFRVIARSKICY
jgi:hypothetical protein